MTFVDAITAWSENTGADDNSTFVPCVTKIPHEEFHMWLLIPSSVMIFVMAMTMSRKNMCLNCFDGRPGVVFPMDILGKSNRFSYAAAWGAIAYLAADVVLNQKFAIRLEGKTYVTVFNGVISMVIYGIDYFPLFAGLAMNSLTGYMISTVYAWLLLVVSVYRQAECDLTYQARLIYILRDLPIWLCMGYLSISLPLRIVNNFRKHTAKLLSSFERVSYFNMEKEIMSSPEAEHVRQLFAPQLPPPPPPQGIEATLKGFVRDWIYHRKKNFRYSSRIISVMLMGVFLIYKTTLELLVAVLSILMMYDEGFERTLEIIGWFPEPDEDSSATVIRNTIFILHNILLAGRVCFIVSVSITCVFGLLTVLHMLASYRTNMLDLYKGDNTHIPHRSTSSEAHLLVGCMRYAGYQVGYIAWGYLIHFVVLLLVSLALAIVITLIKHGEYQWIVHILESYWPVILMTIVISIGQTLMAKLVFLQPGVLAIDNRRILFVASFFLFFYNIFLGLLSCLMRIIKSIVVGAIFLSRLDNSALPRRFQLFDPGFDAYVGFVQIECSHTHPVMLLFMRILMTDRLANKEKDDENSTIVDVEGLELKKSVKNVPNKRARIRWNLLYTLYNNPPLRAHRKAYIQRSRELREKLAKRYNIDLSVATVLVENINTAELNDSDTTLGKDEKVTGGMKTTQMNWNALLGMGKHMRAIRKDMMENETADGSPLSVFGFENKANDHQKIDLNSVESKQPVNRWKRGALAAVTTGSVTLPTNNDGDNLPMNNIGSESVQASDDQHITQDMNGDTIRENEIEYSTEL